MVYWILGFSQGDLQCQCQLKNHLISISIETFLDKNIFLVLTFFTIYDFQSQSPELFGFHLELQTESIANETPHRKLYVYITPLECIGAAWPRPKTRRTHRDDQQLQENQNDEVVLTTQYWISDTDVIGVILQCNISFRIASLWHRGIKASGHYCWVLISLLSFLLCIPVSSWA